MLLKKKFSIRYEPEISLIFFSCNIEPCNELRFKGEESKFLVDLEK